MNCVLLAQRYEVVCYCEYFTKARSGEDITKTFGKAKFPDLYEAIGSFVSG